MPKSKYEPPVGRWAGNHATARYIGISPMCLHRWKRDPRIGFPAATVILDREYNNLQEVDAWMKARVINRFSKETA